MKENDRFIVETLVSGLVTFVLVAWLLSVFS